MRTQSRHHPVGHAADAGLKGQHVFRQAAGGNFIAQEFDHVLGNQVTDPIRRGYFTDMIRFVIHHDPQDFLRIDNGIRPSDPGQGFMYCNGVPVRRGRHHDDVRHFPQPGGMLFIDLDDHVVRILQERRRGTDG